MRCKIKRILHVVIGVAIVFMCISVIHVANPLQTTRGWSKHGYITQFSDIYLPKRSVKKIVLWTTFFGAPFKLEQERSCLSRCDVRCEVTDDKREAGDADAILFHLSDVWSKRWRVGTKSIIEYPSTRKSSQVWILYNLEPPIHMWGDLSIFNGIFNWTQWYRLDSDIPQPYGFKQDLSTEERDRAEINFRSRNFFREKKKEIYVRISNCYDIAQRYKLVDKLNKQLHIDKFGHCYGNTCDVRSCSDETLKQYKFHLAFENDHCNDYLTEKYWQTLSRDQIPIVNWKYGAFPSAIPNSYINIYDFKTMNEAIEFIRTVSANETLYNSFFKYKLRYKEEAKTCGMCAVCRALHDTSKPAQVYTDLESWIRDDTCDKIELWTEITRNVKGFAYYWFGVYW